jgi:antitoxin CptB
MGEEPNGRLAWRCRRGMKELDLVLLRYLRERWPAAAVEERQLFEQLLELPDPLLAAWLMGSAPAPDAPTAALLSILREPATRRAP